MAGSALFNDHSSNSSSLSEILGRGYERLIFPWSRLSMWSSLPSKSSIIVCMKVTKVLPSERIMELISSQSS